MNVIEKTSYEARIMEDMTDDEYQRYIVLKTDVLSMRYRIKERRKEMKKITDRVYARWMRVQKNETM